MGWTGLRRRFGCLQGAPSGRGVVNRRCLTPTLPLWHTYPAGQSPGLHMAAKLLLLPLYCSALLQPHAVLAAWLAMGGATLGVQALAARRAAGGGTRKGAGAAEAKGPGAEAAGGSTAVAADGQGGLVWRARGGETVGCARSGVGVEIWGSGACCRGWG